MFNVFCYSRTGSSLNHRLDPYILNIPMMYVIPRSLCKQLIMRLLFTTVRDFSKILFKIISGLSGYCRVVP